ncbi:hybrid sensor histidine kinase/response regulator [Puniceicoccales bacterium CK1056]|uniref:histidine kinase n=1 Tax=Oceanipulchritudo coccoides TaxID=2706888 RepID=A0A6B2M277_9BACT|nr:hybrid sensor histidine kinase/response regulator [Oceanipulchritudo coccoides]NDV62187.1 hybrid sensor histidine kinase/response regulator [Oceanipulchritudo coccoides]
MALWQNKDDTSTDHRSEQELFKEYYPLVLTILDEIHPLLERTVDQREVLAMASMHLGRLIRARKRVGRRELRKSIEKFLVDNFALEASAEDILNNAVLPPLSEETLKGSRILIVDDSAMARRQIQFFLKRDGFEVYEAKSGEEALWLINEVDPELILMDVTMDGMDGMETCRRIKEDTANLNMPVIFLSAMGDREEIVRGFKSGAIDYIVKPFHPAESLTRIRTHLHVRKLAQLREKNILELKHLNQTKDRILRVASHDLRNPVAAIAGLAEFLKEDTENMSESQQEIVDAIEEAGRSVVTLLNELLDLSAFDSGQVNLKKESLAVCDLIRNLVPLFRGEAERKNIKLEFTCEPGLPKISCDRQQIRRVADNLFSNALKFTPHGGTVSVHVKATGQDVVMEVKDTGPGIPTHESGSLFKEFGTTSNMPTGGEKSTGLGLSICHRIVTAHKGSINYVNLPEGGTCFSVTLPAIIT